MSIERVQYLKGKMKNITSVDTEKYLDFVKGVTSLESLDYAALLSRTNKLELEDDCNIPQLLTAALGLTAESGEFTEVVKKIILQGNLIMKRMFFI